VVLLKNVEKRGAKRQRRIAGFLIERRLLISLSLGKTFEGIHNSGEIVVDRVPEDLFAPAEMPMDDKIAHGAHVRPRNPGTAAADFLRYMIGRFPYDREAAHEAKKESFSPCKGVSPLTEGL